MIILMEMYGSVFKERIGVRIMRDYSDTFWAT